MKAEQTNGGARAMSKVTFFQDYPVRSSGQISLPGCDEIFFTAAFFCPMPTLLWVFSGHTAPILFVDHYKLRRIIFHRNLTNCIMLNSPAVNEWILVIAFMGSSANGSK